MKTIIAGGRDVCDKRPLWYAVCDIKWNITEVISGTARGMDTMGETYAQWANLPIKKFPAEWDNFDLPGAVRKKGQYGDYNATAGFFRNEEMAKHADAIIIIWDGKSRGSADMKQLAEQYGLQGYEVIVNGQTEDSGNQVRVLHSTDGWTRICFNGSEKTV